MKKLIIACFLGLALGLLWNCIYNFRLDPTLHFWWKCADVSDGWAEQLRRTPEPCYVFAGGSETRIGIDPQLLADDYGLRAINAGSQAGFGASSHIEAAMYYLQPGDTLLVTFNAYNFAKGTTKFGLNYLWPRMGFAMFRDGMIPLTYRNLRTAVSGDACVLSICLAKMALSSGPLYNYEKDSRIHPSGWMEVLRQTNVKQRRVSLSLRQLQGLNQPDMQFLLKLQKVCQDKGIRLLLWARPCCVTETYRAAAAKRALDAVRNGLPVLKDERLGAITDKNLFSDSGVHLNNEGVRQQMQIIGNALKHNACWTEEELIAILSSYGYDASGRKITP